MMPSQELYQLTVREAARLVAERDVSALDLTEAVLARLEETEPALHAYATVMADEARQAARSVDAQDGPRGALAGVPIALKDLYDVTGVRTGGGSPSRDDHVAAADSFVTSRLREAGAVIIGKTVTHEFAFGVTSPPARCAWDPARTPGGSSGGSGAAVAAGSAIAALGTDTGASIRLPAALNGITGLKPTYGRVSRAGVIPLAWSCDHAGPLAKTVEDAAIVLQVIAGHDATDPGSAREPVPDFSDDIDAGLTGLRIGIPKNYFF